MADVFKAGGYRTGIFGKWHLGDNYPSRPMDRGFDVSVVHGGGGVTQTPDYWDNDYFNDNMGRLTAMLKETGLDENTILIFMTDNGTAAGIARNQNNATSTDSWKGFNDGMRRL